MRTVLQPRPTASFLTKPDRAAKVWLGVPSVVTAWLGLALALISPVHGIGAIQLCWIGSTGIPCLGCGLTRSLSCALRGRLVESWNYHPFGPLILVLFGVIALQSLLPDNHRHRIGEYVQARAVMFNSIHLAFVAVFIGYGIVRALSCATVTD